MYQGKVNQETTIKWYVTRLAQDLLKGDLPKERLLPIKMCIHSHTHKIKSKPVCPYFLVGIKMEVSSFVVVATKSTFSLLL